MIDQTDIERSAQEEFEDLCWDYHHRLLELEDMGVDHNARRSELLSLSYPVGVAQ